MAEAPRNPPLPSGYDEDFVNTVEDDFDCLICHLALKETVLTRCGHRFCKECLEEHFRRQGVQGQPLTCPADRESLDQDRDVFPDKATERKILSLAIRCPSEGCDWTGELRSKEIHLAACLFKLNSCTNENCHVTARRKDLEQHVTTTCQWRINKCEHCSEPHPHCKMQDHIVQCSKFPVTCPNNCGGSIPREMIPNHTENDCPLTIISCPYEQMGCKTKAQRKQVESHLQSAVRLHLDLACVNLNKTEVKLYDTEAALNNTEVKLYDTEAKLNKTEVALNKTDAKLTNTEVRLNNTEVKLNKAEIMLTKTEAKLNNTEVKLNNTDVKLNNTEVKLNNTEVKLNKTEETTRKLMKKLDTLERRFEEKVIKDQENVIEEKKVLEKKDLTQKFVCKINDFSEMLRQAKTEENFAIASTPFYTASYGYKLKVKIYPNGFGCGKNTHLSVIIPVMKGEYDAILPWPFKNEVKFTLIDQQEDPVKREDVALKFDTNNYRENASFARPVEEENRGGGFDKFISHEKLHSRRYILEDTLFLQVEVSPSSNLF